MRTVCCPCLITACAAVITSTWWWPANTPLPQWLTMDAAVVHCTEGIGIWQWASNDQGTEPDVVMACCGDTPTLEILAAVSILRQHLPDLKIRVINVVDLMKLQPKTEHPHGLSETVTIRYSRRQAHHFWLSWIPLAGPPADLSPHQIAISTSVATRKKERLLQLLICGCRMTWIAFIWCKTWWTACQI